MFNEEMGTIYKLRNDPWYIVEDINFKFLTNVIGAGGRLQKVFKGDYELKLRDFLLQEGHST